MMKTHKRFALARIPAFFILFMVFITVSACSSDSLSPNSVNQTGQAASAMPDDPKLIAESWPENLTIHFLDVGQGLSILCESNGQYLLYDGGDRDASSFVVSYLKKQGVETLDYIIVSHYDADHLNGVIGALNVFQTGTVIGPDYTHDSKLYQSFLSALKASGKTMVHPSVKDTFSFGNCKFEVLGPSEIVTESNNNSIVIKLSYGDTSFIFTGDAEHGEEQDIVESGSDLSCDVLSIGHHGSNDSTSRDFLHRLMPEYAVISCGRDNQHGHPGAETMERIQAINAKIFRTDEQGTIIVTSDGKSLNWNTAPSENYKSGISDQSPAVWETEASSTAYHAQTQGHTAADYILNKNSRKFHSPGCKSIKSINPANYEEYEGTRDALIAKGYNPCGNCNP